MGFTLTAHGMSAFATSQWLKGNLLKRIRINGSRQLGFHLHNVAGDNDAFKTSNYYGQGRFSDVGQLTVTGNRVLDLFNFSFQVQNNRFGNPQGQRFTTQYERNGLRAGFGDIQASSVSNNTFVGFNRSLNGAQFGYSKGPLSFSVVQSRSRGSAQTISIQGNGSAGPYYLNAAQLIQDSDRVMVDGVQLVRGNDYTLNYETGTLTFSSRVIPQTSSIVVSFEAFGASSATVRGFSVGLGLGKENQRGRLGLIVLEQNQRGQKGLGTRTDLYQGYGDPATPYTLTLVPLNAASVQISVDGRVQTLDVDYRFDAQNPAVFFFNRFISPNSTVTVVYTPRPSQVIDGDRKVTGIDYSLPFGSEEAGMGLNLSFARGSLTNTPTPQSGYAKGASIKSRLGKRFNFESTYSDIDPGYVSVESVGFNRNQRSLGWSLTGTARHLAYGVQTSNSSVSNRASSTDGSLKFDSSRAVTSEFFASFNRTDARPVKFSHVRQNAFSATQDNQIDTTSLSTNFVTKGWTTSLEFENLAGRAFANSTRTLLGMQTLRASAANDLGRGLQFRSRLSASNIRSGGEQSRGQDFSLGLTYNPQSRFTGNLGYTVSKAGELAALNNFRNGFGQGYGSNGFSGSTVSNTPVSGATNLNQLIFSGNYRASDRLSMGGRITSLQSTGSVSSNTRQFGLGGDLTLDLGRGHRAYGSLDFTETRFLANGARSRNINMTGDLSGGLRGGVSYSLRGNAFFSTGTAQAQNYLALDAGLRKQLSLTEGVYLQLRQGLTTGYQPQNEQMLGFGYEKRLWNMISVSAGYRWRNVQNALSNLSGGAYRSSGIDIDFNFAFDQ